MATKSLVGSARAAADRTKNEARSETTKTRVRTTSKDAIAVGYHRAV